MKGRATGEGMVAGSVVALAASLVDSHGGTPAVQRWLSEAGCGLSRTEVEDPTRWTPFDHAMALLEAAADILDEPDLGWVVGVEMLRQYRGTEVHALLRSLGSPSGVIANVPQSAAKFTTAHALRTSDSAETSAVVVSDSPGGHHHEIWCRFTAGLFSQTSSLFGMDDAVVVETECIGRGDAMCTFEITWDPSTGPATEAERLVAHLEDEIASITSRFEALQATATELVSTDDLSELLHLIIRRAGYAVRATHYVLAVRLTAGGKPHVEHRGYHQSDPHPGLIDALLSDKTHEPDDRDGSLLVVDVATRHQWFGRLAAVFPEGRTFLPEERRLLKAYAANAANALEATAARTEADRRHRTAEALLDLSAALGEVGTSVEVAQRLAEAVVRLMGSTHAGVLLWSEADGCLTYRGFAGYTPQTEAILREVTVTRADTPVLSTMMAERKPIFLRADMDDPYLSALLSVTEVDQVVVVPIATQDRFLGVVATPVSDERDDELDADLLARLSGMTSQGATALENARLVEALHHQGLHDPLSGLANRRLFRTRLDQALERGRSTGSPPAVVFIDLDHFKSLNDGCGHEVGDKVITAVGERMRSIVRSTDTVARLGGDEFAVILEGLKDPRNDALRVAEALVRSVREPLAVGGRSVRTSASAGVVLARPKDDHDSMLRRADANMYEAKSVGRNRAVLDRTA